MQKIEALGQLTGGIAHDFNNMLAVVMSGLTLLRRRMERGEKDLESYVNGAIESTQRAAALTQRLLTFARRRDAMTTGGELTIKATHVILEEQHKDHHGARPGESISISLSDNGCGMTPDTKARAFEPFFTTKPVGAGTGLGLSQVLGFVTQSGGLVKIDSEPGRGTTVSLYLPRIEAAVATASSGIHSPLPNEGERDELILVVEDEPRLLAFTVAALKDL